MVIAVRRMAVAVVVAAGLAAGLAAGPVMADEGSEAAPPWAGQQSQLLFETAAFGALAVGGRFKLVESDTNGVATQSSVSLADHGAFALTADLRADEGTQYELFYSREATGLRGNSAAPRTDVTVEYLHLGGTVLLDDEQRVKPYMAGGLGISRFTPGQDGSTDTRFSVSLGLGLRWPVTQHFAVRLEGRAFLSLVNPDAAVFCRSDQNGLLCRIHGNGQTFIQGEFLAGAAFAF
jgi:opacity protein-like surface antigen